MRLFTHFIFVNVNSIFPLSIIRIDDNIHKLF